MTKKLGRTLPRLGGRSSLTSFRAKADPKKPPSKAGFSFGLHALTDRERLEEMAAGETGTLPERLVRAWLIKSGLLFQEQQGELGGRLIIGGAIVDFVVWVGDPPGMVIRVQGDYWHSLQPRKAKDRVQYERLIAKGYRVSDLWENDIYRSALDGWFPRYMSGIVYGGSAG